MLDPALLLAGIHFASTFQALGGIATFLVVLVLPAIWYFHKKVIKPLSFVLGLKQEDSPTGEAIPPIPQQLHELRKGQKEMRTTQIELQGDLASIRAEVFPNHGGSLRDSVNRNETMTKAVQIQVVDLTQKVDTHISDEREARENVSALALKTAAELAALTAKTASDLARKPHE